MKKAAVIFLFFLSFESFAQFVAVVQLEENIPGICDKEHVYAIFPGMKDQEKAICPISDGEILAKLNEQVTFLKDNPKYKDKGMIGLYVNCQGEVVKCKMDNKTKNAELDAQIEAVFKSIGVWKAGKVTNKNVDTYVLYSFKVSKGKITFD